ncbi:hypothetical protein LJB96_04095 [Methanobrevibacter sp. OttesenSCG-928-K11]|nr:hypothetical protein [Methanobrevibacter sp. OttesenSCG-928-K11]
MVTSFPHCLQNTLKTNERPVFLPSKFNDSLEWSWKITKKLAKLLMKDIKKTLNDEEITILLKKLNQYFEEHYLEKCTTS